MWLRDRLPEGGGRIVFLVTVARIKQKGLIVNFSLRIKHIETNKLQQSGIVLGNPLKSFKRF